MVRWILMMFAMSNSRKLYGNSKIIDIVDHQFEHKKIEMSEEIKQRGYGEQGLKIGPYQYYNLGNTQLSTLKKYKIIPNRKYGNYENNKPDALLIDRRNKSKLKVIVVIEHKSHDEFKTKQQQQKAIEQCNTSAQILKAEIGIVTDTITYIWFNPNEHNIINKYKDKYDEERSYNIIQDENGDKYTEIFNIDQTDDEIDVTKLNLKTKKSIQYLDIIRESVSKDNSKIIKSIERDPTQLAKQIWQDVWSVTGKDPEKCLYTFVELFIFKYLSDLEILTKDEKGNKVNFSYIYSLENIESFKNYSDNVRTHLKKMFKKSDEDGTTIINGTVLNPEVNEHNIVFHKILKRFDDFGKIESIDPSFKSKVFEEFMKESISTKNWGRYFTPRNVIDAMIEMSDIDKLDKGSKICDPACGVGGFILEPMKVKKDARFYHDVVDGHITSRYNFYGFDKGFEKEEQLTIILAKANMLIFLSELLKNNEAILDDFSDLLNTTFHLTKNSILGTLEKTKFDEYDLIITNPPYVTSGSSNYKDAINSDPELKNFYKVCGMGVESLFLEWIIRSIKPNKKALVVIPDGILYRIYGDKIRQMILDECIVDAIISLPIKTFYKTPKKTYILIVTKKDDITTEKRKKIIQSEPVFTYLVSNIGETLDIYRSTKNIANDLLESVCLFNQFKGSKITFKTNSKRCKIQKISKFKTNDNWGIDRWWTQDEKIALGIEDKDDEVTKEEFITFLKEKEKQISDMIVEISEH